MERAGSVGVHHVHLPLQHAGMNASTFFTGTYIMPPGTKAVASKGPALEPCQSEQEQTVGDDQALS